MYCDIPIAFNVFSFLVNFCTTTTTTTKIMCKLCKGFFWIFLQKLPFFEEKHMEVTTFRCRGHGGHLNKAGFSKSTTFLPDI
jgi:hypothetical protein